MKTLTKHNFAFGPGSEINLYVNHRDVVKFISGTIQDIDSETQTITIEATTKDSKNHIIVPFSKIEKTTVTEKFLREATIISTSRWIIDPDGQPYREDILNTTSYSPSPFNSQTQPSTQTDVKTIQTINLYPLPLTPDEMLDALKPSEFEQNSEERFNFEYSKRPSFERIHNIPYLVLSANLTTEAH